MKGPPATMGKHTRNKSLPKRGPAFGCTKARTCVCLHVLIKVLLHVEILPAPLAHELLMTDVDTHVRTKLVLVLEPFVAILQTGTTWDQTGTN